MCEAFADGGERLFELFDGVTRGDVLWAVPVEAFDVDEDDALDNSGVIFGAERVDERGGFGVVLVDFDSSEDFEAGLVRVVHEEEGYTGVMLEIAEADVL